MYPFCSDNRSESNISRKVKTSYNLKLREYKLSSASTSPNSSSSLINIYGSQTIVIMIVVARLIRLASVTLGILLLTHDAGKKRLRLNGRL
jgi:hypothetical protein